jgi:serine/threonine protein phosphatase PrpC
LDGSDPDYCSAGAEAVARRAAEALVRQALEAGSGDNVTAAVALFDWGE